MAAAPGVAARLARVHGVTAAAAVAATMLAVGTGTAAAAAPVFFSKAAIGAKAPGASFAITFGAWFIEGEVGSKITCTAASGSGEVTGPTSVANVSVTLKGCETAGIPCENAGRGEIALETLAGSLGNVTATAPGLRLFNQAEGKGGVLARYECAGGVYRVEWRGSMIGALTGASGTTVAEGKLATSFKLVYAETKGVQKYVKFLPGEGEPGSEQVEQTTSGGPPEKVGESVQGTTRSTPFAGDLGFTK